MEELIPFIQQQHSLGVSDADIKNILKVRGGWEDEEVEKAYAMAFSGADPALVVTPIVANEIEPTHLIPMDISIDNPETQLVQGIQNANTPLSSVVEPPIEAPTVTVSPATDNVPEDNYNPFTFDETKIQTVQAIDQVHIDPVVVSGANIFTEKMTEQKMTEPINRMLEHSEVMQVPAGAAALSDVQMKSVESFRSEINTPKIELFIPTQAISAETKNYGGFDISSFPTPRVKSNSIYGGGSLNINKSEIQSTNPLATVTMGNMMNTAPVLSTSPRMNVENSLHAPTAPQSKMRIPTINVKSIETTYAQTGVKISSTPDVVPNITQNAFVAGNYMENVSNIDSTSANQLSSLTLEELSYKRTILSSILMVIFVTFLVVAGYMFFTSPVGAPFLIEIKSKVGNLLSENGITVFNTVQSEIEPIGSVNKKMNASLELPLGAISYKYSIKGQVNIPSIPKEVMPYMSYLGLVENGDITINEEGVSVQTPKANSQKDVELEIIIGDKNKKFHIKTPKQIFFIERQLYFDESASISYENQKLVLTEKVATLLGAKDQAVPQVSRFGSNSIELILQNISLLKPELIKKVEDNNNKGEVHYLVDYINFKDPEMVKLLKFIGKNIDDKKTLFEELDINIDVKNIDIAIDSKSGMISSMIGTMNYVISDKEVALLEIKDADITFTIKSHTSDVTLITIDENELNQNMLNISGNWAKGTEKSMYTNPWKEWLDRIQVTLNANIKDEILRIRSDAIALKKKTGTYKGICEDSEGSVSMGIAELLNKTKVLCYSSEKDFAVSAQLKDETYFCASNKEKGKILNGVIDKEVCEPAIVEGSVEVDN